MKRYSDSIGGRWKRICPPADDSDSDSSQSSEGSSDDAHVTDLYRRLYQYGGPNCSQCGFPNLVCSCNVRHSLSTTSRQSMILIGVTQANADQLDGSEEATNSNSHNNATSNASNGGAALHSAVQTGRFPELSVDSQSVSFRASTSIEQFTVSDSSETTLRYPCSISRRRTMFSDQKERNAYATTSLAGILRDDTLKDAVQPKPAASTSATASSLGASASNATTEKVKIPSLVPIDESNSEMDEFHARIVSLLECPVCLEPITPPIHQCRRGHLVCGKCRSQLTHCPSCRDKMCDMRNWAIERIAELLKYPCRNAGLGCQVTALLSAKTAHEATCPYRHYSCLFRTCSWTGFQQEMLPHLRSAHPLRFLEGARQQIDVELNSPTLFYTDWAIACFGHVFRFNVFQHIPNSMFYASAYLVGGGYGPGNCESDYTYTVTVNGSLGRRTSYTRQTHAESTRTSQLCHSEDCFSIRGDKMEHFVREGGKLRLHVELEKLETPNRGYQGN